MIRYLKRAAARFCRKEDGALAIEMVILLPAFGFILAGTVEMGLMNMRHAMLERGLDMTVREVRLSTGFTPDYASIKTSICDYSMFNDCEDNLRLEMKVVDPRNYVGIEGTVDCHNAIETARPRRAFESGEANEMMLLRACLTFKPLFPTTALGAMLPKDGNGYVPLVATSAFVQEPR